MKKNNTINILWIDDKFYDDDGKDIVSSANTNGINLVGFECGDDGLSELNENYYEYDGVLLDVRTKYYRDDNDSPENFVRIIQELSRIMSKRTEKEYFILTGKEPGISQFTKKKIYHKNALLVGDDISIWEEIKSKIVSFELNTIRKKYFEVLEVGSLIDSHINKDVKKKILTLAMHLNGTHFDAPFNHIRRILDSIFLYLFKTGDDDIRANFKIKDAEIISNLNSVNLTNAFCYFQHNQSKEYNPKTWNSNFRPLTKTIDWKKKEFEYFLNKKPWPSDISQICKNLFAKGTPVQGLNHEQEEVDEFKENHFQNVSKIQYFSYAYIHNLFILLLWLKKNI